MTQDFKILPQTHVVGHLLRAAIAALPNLPESREKEALCIAVKRFESCVVLTSWHVDDVLDHRPDLSVEEVKETLCHMYKDYEPNERDYEFLRAYAQFTKVEDK